MSVRLGEDGAILLEGPCPIEDAEALLSLLLSHPQARVDWRACESAHTAVVQLLLASARLVDGPPTDDFLARHINPALSRPKPSA
jgi:hypothetical protein